MQAQEHMQPQGKVLRGATSPATPSEMTYTYVNPLCPKSAHQAAGPLKGKDNTNLLR